MTVIAHDPFIRRTSRAICGIELVSLDDLCARADYLSLHMPATPQTRHIFNAERLAQCKKGLRIINTARGELIDEAALVDAIESAATSAARARCLQTRADDGPRAAAAAAGRGQAAHRGVDAREARNWSASKPPRRSAIS